MTFLPFSVGARSILMLSLAVTVANAKTPEAPVSIRGVWDVEHIAMDLQDSIHQTYQPDDAELMASTLVIEPQGVRFSLDKLGCTQKQWQPRPSRWRALFASGFPRPPVGDRSPRPTPKDFGISFRDDRTIAYPICPTTGDKFPRGSWVALKDGNVLLYHHDTQLLFVLRKRSPDARPTPSFACAAAANATEKAICQSFDLAAWDRSVDLAVRQLLETWPDKKPAVLKDQEQWRRTRDACLGNTACIDEALRRRVEALAWQRKVG